MSAQPIYYTRGALEEQPKLLAYKLVGLAEVLLSQGNVEDAYRLARTALRGFVSSHESGATQTEELQMFLSGIEFFTSEACKESPAMRNSLIRLYGRLLHLKHAYMHDWDFAEHPILRSCVLHGLSGGNASALADLNRKSKLWRMNPDGGYVVTTGFDKSTRNGSEDTELDEPAEPLPIKPLKPRKKQLRFRGVTEKLIRQRQSPVIAEWMQSLAR